MQTGRSPRSCELAADQTCVSLDKRKQRPGLRAMASSQLAQQLEAALRRESLFCAQKTSRAGSKPRRPGCARIKTFFGKHSPQLGRFYERKRLAAARSGSSSRSCKKTRLGSQLDLNASHKFAR